MSFTVETAFGYLQNASTARRLAHAYLIVGPTGSGKTELAAKLVSMVNGGSLAESLDALEDENVRVVRPESKSRRIKVEQMRGLEKMFYQRAASGVTKVGIIADADRMGEQAEIAFLKTLEEPPDGCLLLLLTAFPEQLLDTILSRCILVTLRDRSGGLPGGESIDLLRRMLSKASSAPGVSEALGMAKRFSELLKSVKEEGEKGAEAEQKKEKETYAKTTDGRWLKGREEYHKAVGASAYLARRAEMLEVLVAWFGDALRQQNGFGKLDLPGDAEHTAKMAREVRPAELQRRMAAVEGLRDDLATNVQEGLAIEVAFLEAFGGA